MAETENRVPGGVNAQGEQPHLENAAAKPKTQDPGGATPTLTASEAAGANSGEPVAPPEEPRPPRAEYEVVTSKREEPQSEYMAEHYKRISQQVAAGGKGPVSQARISEGSIGRINKAGSGQTRVYVAIGIGLGLVVGLTAAVLLLHPGGPGGPSDMGDVNSTEYGLKGHLATEWKGERLAYHLTVEPGTPLQRAGFLANVNGSPRPLSVTVQAKDPFGAVLCSDTIQVKFDPRNAPVSAPEGPMPKSAKAAQELAARNEIAREVNLARLEGQELNRERGKTLFQNQIGKDGQVASISAQGVLPCHKKEVDRFASWGFTSDFPIVAKPAVSQDGPTDPKANVNTAAIEEEAKKNAAAERAAAAAAAKTRKKPAPPPLTPIFVEGDDQIVWVDPSGGVVETNGGKALILDKGDKLGTALKGGDLPIAIHYRCNETSGCTFSVTGLGIHHARLRQ